VVRVETDTAAEMGSGVETGVKDSTAGVIARPVVGAAAAHANQLVR
jgi:hypothetical protein